MIGKYIATIICVLCLATSLSLSLGIGFMFGAGIGFVVFSVLCCVMIFATLLFAQRIAREVGDRND